MAGDHDVGVDARLPDFKWSHVAHLTKQAPEKLLPANALELNINDVDKSLAWKFLNELRTRIAIQPLHYVHGDEKAALESFAKLFQLVRDMVRDAGPTAWVTAHIIITYLNRDIRPVTARWHKRSEAGAFDREDACHEFRDDFASLQRQLVKLASVLGTIVTQTEYDATLDVWPETSRETLKASAESRPAANLSLPLPSQMLSTSTVWSGIQQAEHKAIRERRGATTGQKLDENQTVVDVSGLAISGGGIRSATFALGVLQVLADKKILPEFDYLSTVSGGGYLGSFLSAFLSTNEQNEVGLGRDKLPFKKGPSGESEALRHIRGHSKYLLSGGTANSIAMAVSAAYGYIMSIVCFLPLMVIVPLLCACCQQDSIQQLIEHPTPFFEFAWSDCSLRLALFSIPIVIASLLVLRPLLKQAGGDQRYKHSRIAVGLVCIALIGFCLARILPYGLVLGSGWLGKGINSQSSGNSGFPVSAASLASISGILMYVQRYWLKANAAARSAKVKRLINSLVLMLVGPVFVLASTVLISHFFVVHPIAAGSKPHTLSLLLLFTVPFFVSLFININQTSLHPFYREKLSEAFLFRLFSTSASQSDTTSPADDLKLSTLREHNKRGPYHLINAALNAPASQNGALKGRGTDFFLFSPCYTGSEATGYAETKEWEKVNSDLNLGTAMAISGAAASPVMGVVPLPTMRFLLALFNVRLDYWLRNPAKRSQRLPWPSYPNVWYLFLQALGWMTEKSKFINVSDGGHIENLGLYELLRRRCRYIVVIDGECDPKLQCGALMQAQRFAKLDFGVDITIDTSRFESNADGSTKFHFTYGTIHYPPTGTDGHGSTGELIYIKLSRTGNEPPGINYYRLTSPDFPHESTADQFFTEDQFEAYRALGEHVANDLFKGANKSPIDGSVICVWLRNLSDLLRDPLQR